METYLIRVRHKGQQWFIHADGTRSENRLTAELFTVEEADTFIARVRRNTLLEECAYICVDPITREDA